MKTNRSNLFQNKNDEKEFKTLGMVIILESLYLLKRGFLPTYFNCHWWLVELPMWLTDGFSVTFFGRSRGAVRIHVSHVQLTCGN